MRLRVIERPRLLPIESPPLTLVHAPAGYGKTVMAAQWAQHQTPDTCVIWVRGADIDPDRFWEVLCEAFTSCVGADAAAWPAAATNARGIAVNPSNTANAANASNASNTAEIAARKLASSFESSIMLVIDNFEGLTSPELDIALVDMIEQSPMLKMVVISRRFSMFDGPFTKARLSTRLITANDLVFREQEVRELAAFYGPTDDESVIALMETTVGWPLALHAVLSDKGGRQGGGRITSAHISCQLSLIANDCLELISSEDQRRVLFAVAVCPGLSTRTFAETMVGRRLSEDESASAVHARTLRAFRELGDLGLIERVLPQQAHRYKCHEGLAAELYKRAGLELTKFELDRLARAHVADLSADDPFSAIALYCDAGDFVSAERLLTIHLAEATGADHGLGVHIRGIPAEQLSGFPVLASARLVMGVFDEYTSDEWVRAALEDLRSDVLKMFSEGVPQSDNSAVATLLLVERMLGNQENALNIARDIEQRLSETPKGLVRTLGGSVPFVYALLGFTAVINGELGLADRCYGRALQLAKQMNSLVEQIRSLYGLALCAFIAGEKRRARQLADRAKRLEVEWSELGPPLVTFEAAPVKALLAAELGDEITVKRLRDDLAPLRGRLETWPLMIIAEAESNRRFRGVYVALTVLRSHLSEKTRVVATTPFLKNKLTAYAAGLQMMLGNLASAEQHLQALAEGSPDRALGTVRLALLKGAPERASRMLDDAFLGHLTRRQRCDYLLLSAAVSWQVGFRKEALNDFLAAIPQMEQACGFGRLSIVPYDTLLGLAQAAAESGDSKALEQVTELPENLRYQQYEQLSPAELRTVEALVENQPLEQTAATLFISLNTLKFHLRNIYRKLKVVSREEAVRSAIRMGLLGGRAAEVLDTELMGGREGGKPEKRDIVSI